MRRMIPLLLPWRRSAPTPPAQAVFRAFVLTLEKLDACCAANDDTRETPR